MGEGKPEMARATADDARLDSLNQETPRQAIGPWRRRNATGTTSRRDGVRVGAGALIVLAMLLQSERRQPEAHGDWS